MLPRAGSVLPPTKPSLGPLVPRNRTTDLLHFTPRPPARCAASLAHPSALTRHLSLSRPRGALGSGPAAAAAAAAAATPPATPWRLTRQPSTRWVSVSATDAAKQYGSQSAASGRASGVGGGLAPPSRAVLSRRHGSGGALAAAGAAAAGAEGSATATAVPPQGRSWASLQVGDAYR